jgi:hypothetical protein
MNVLQIRQCFMKYSTNIGTSAFTREEPRLALSIRCWSRTDRCKSNGGSKVPCHRVLPDAALCASADLKSVGMLFGA